MGLLTSFGSRANSKIVRVKYSIVNAPSSYNVIVGREALNDLGAVVFTVHLMMKFSLTNENIGVVKAYQLMARRCYKDSLRIRRGEWEERREEAPHGVFFAELDPQG